MPDEKKKVVVTLSQREYKDLKYLAVFHFGNDDIRFSWRLPRMIHDFCLDRIKLDRRLISAHHILMHQFDNQRYYHYPKIKQAIELIRETHNNALKIALNDEKRIINQKDFLIAS